MCREINSWQNMEVKWSHALLPNSQFSPEQNMEVKRSHALLPDSQFSPEQIYSILRTYPIPSFVTSPLFPVLCLNNTFSNMTTITLISQIYWNATFARFYQSMAIWYSSMSPDCRLNDFILITIIIWNFSFKNTFSALCVHRKLIYCL